MIEYLGLLLAKLSGDRLSIRFVLFALVGASGLLVHLVALRLLFGASGMAFDGAQTGAAYVAMTWNFLLNNRLTYRDRRLRGWQAVKGLVSFYAVCSVGAVAKSGGELGLSRRTELVVGRHGRSLDGGGLQLCSQLHLHLAPALRLAPLRVDPHGWTGRR